MAMEWKPTGMDPGQGKAAQVPVRDGRTSPQHAPRRVWSVCILVGILAVAGYLRFTGLNWDEGQYIHPDEGHMRNTISLISWPDDLSLYFDTHQSPLNVRNRGHQYSYGTLPLFLARATAEWLDEACDVSPGQLSRAVGSLLVGTAIDDCRPGSFTGVYNALVGRPLSGLADLGTLVLLYFIGRRLYGGGAGLLAAGLGAVTAFLIQQAHFFTVDSLSCFFVMVVALFSVRASEGGRWSDFALAGTGVGLAAACKVSSATAALLVLLAAVSHLLYGGAIVVGRGETRARLDLSELRRLSARLLVAGLLSLIVFRVAQPYAFEGPGFFGLRPSPEWFGRLRDIQAEQSGRVDLPSGRQWANRLPIVFPWANMVVWGMGLPLGLAAWTGWVAAGYELLTGSPRGRKHLVLWGWATVLFVYLGTRWVKTMRYFLPLYPILLLFAASWLTGLVRSSRQWLRRAGIVLASGVTLGAVLWGLAFFTVYLRPHPRIAASRWIFERIPQGVTVANEHWDWGLPLRIDGNDPFGGMYAGIEMQNYDEDTVQKRLELISWLDRTDWIFLASNRLYASISRLPTRYPLTIAYYRALFAGELGFELEADFTSYPALGPFVFPDQETPFELMEASYASQVKPTTVQLPAAEEAFSVYDHPRVLLFRKTEDYSTELVRRVLDRVDLERVQHGRAPQQATEAPKLLEFETEVWADQQAGGTWSAMFNRDGLLNRYPALAAVAWWLVVTGLGLSAFPLLYAIVPSLRDRGYGFSRILGLLLVSYLTWLAASLRVFPNTRATIVRMVALLALLGVGVAALNWEGLTTFFRQRWRTVLWIEGLYVILFAGWVGVRHLQPDLWHPVVGGEKPMDFAYLNAVMKSTWFPPYNPWLSGTWINYYYFGFVIVGTLIKLTGTIPAVGYNLAVPVIFAVTGVSAFSLAYSLFGGDRRGARLSGLAAVVFTILLGNLGVVHLIRTKLIALGDVSFPSTIPGFPETVAFFRGLWRVVFTGAGFGVRPESWYWHPTRIIPASTGDPIAEFPAFTFLYGDLHAHMIAFPLTLFSLGLALHLARTRQLHWATLPLAGLVIGALRATNTWDYPTYLLLGLMAMGLGAWQGVGRSERARTRKQRDDVGDQVLDAGLETSQSTDPRGLLASRAGSGKLFLLRAVALIALSVMFYLPYLRHYVAGYDSIELWGGGTTPLSVYLWIHAILLFPVVTRLVVHAVEEARQHQAFRQTVAGASAGALLIGAVLYAMGYSVALVAMPIGALAAVLLFAPRRSEREEPVNSRRLLWLSVGTAMALSIAVEVVVLQGDIGRMNTVFKFYLQVWVLLAIAAATSLVWVWERAQRWTMGLRDVWLGAMALLIAGGGLFLPLGVRARSIDRMAPSTGVTLDGMAFMQGGLITDGPEGDVQEISLAGDYHAIRWMQETIEGSPVIIEGLGRHEYLWANRVSIHTGLPAVVGWGWHQVQQRAGVGGDLVNWRRADVNAFYETRDIARAEEILARYNVGYIYVGEYERAYYDQQGLEKFERMVRQGLLQVVYDARGTTVYEVASQSGH